MNIRISFPVCLLLILGLAAPAAPEAGERLTMRVSPAQSFAPATLWVQVRVEPNANNRALEVIADSIQFYRSSQIQLDGERAPRIVALDFRGVPSGEYEIRGVLTDGAGHERASARRQVTVIASGSER
jgi:hypothetical protein